MSAPAGSASQPRRIINRMAMTAPTFSRLRKILFRKHAASRRRSIMKRIAFNISLFTNII
ncbi:hypothetical protein RBA41_14555 [Massilia sp. CCM 9210]|uniref:hypothetical protein n=1 Tax=Massilia scottii TaxID=3057166 RepID=UPI002796AF8C|nr:hypothetical protein [Massilia sp. CCM 9210]MDQ1814529.1 hypothetical protein [Massilia sp. CCM 9210]